MVQPPLLFGPDRRVRRRADFVRSQTLGRRVSTAHFLFLVHVVQLDGGFWRLGLVATRKIGNAVARNRIKRVCRECFRHSSLFSQGEHAADLVVIAKTGAETLSYAEAQSEWNAAAEAIAARARDGVRTLRQRSQRNV